MVSMMEPLVGRDAMLLLGDAPLVPGEQRRIGFYFLAGEDAAEIMRQAGRFYLWEGGVIGEAEVAA